MTDQQRLPKRYEPDRVEPKWRERWGESGIYRFDPDSAKPIFSIDTPPPTVSGELHVGHVFSYTHTDLTARFRRMCGRNTFYPMGWDDNGLPTERRVQELMNVRCEPRLPYQPGFEPDPEADEPTPPATRTPSGWASGWPPSCSTRAGSSWAGCGQRQPARTAARPRLRSTAHTWRCWPTS